MLSISVVVPVHNGGEAFLSCLESLTHATSDVDEIIVVADGETDGMWRRAYGTGARVLVNPTSRGPAVARNVGARAAKSEILLFIDADVCVQRNTIDLVRGAFEADLDLAALFGSYDDEPAASTLLSQYRNLLHHFTHQRAEEEASTFWGGCGAIRSDVFKDVGGFDDTFARACIEDIELGCRLKHSGYRIKLRKDIQVKHLKRWTAVNMIRTDLFDRAVPWTELMLSYRALPLDLNLRAENRASVVLVYVTLGLMLFSFAFPPLLFIAGVSILALIALNRDFYRLLRRKHGTFFTALSIPWHCLFYFYSGVGFLIGVSRFLRNRLRSKVDVNPSDSNGSNGVSKTVSHSIWAEAK